MCETEKKTDKVATNNLRKLIWCWETWAKCCWHFFMLLTFSLISYPHFIREKRIRVWVICAVNYSPHPRDMSCFRQIFRWNFSLFFISLHQSMSIFILAVCRVTAAAGSDTWWKMELKFVDEYMNFSPTPLASDIVDSDQKHISIERRELFSRLSKIWVKKHRTDESEIKFMSRTTFLIFSQAINWRKWIFTHKKVWLLSILTDFSQLGNETVTREFVFLYKNKRNARKAIKTQKKIKSQPADIAVKTSGNYRLNCLKASNHFFFAMLMSFVLSCRQFSLECRSSLFILWFCDMPADVFHILSASFDSERIASTNTVFKTRFSF